MENPEVVNESDRWAWSIGEDQLKVTVYERPTKGHMLYLRWRAMTPTGRNWRHVSLGAVLRDSKGKIKRDIMAFAKEQAKIKYRTLGQPDPEPAPSDQLLLGQTIALVIDKDKGLYPKKSNHRSEVIRALKVAADIWGPSTPWARIKKAEIRQLWRRRLEDLKKAGHVGARGAETTVGRVLTVASWLRDEELIPVDACVAPRKWKQVLRDEAGNPDPKRPRYTLDEMRRIHDVAPQVEPRFALLVAMGAELRLGQVLRVMRHDLDLQAKTVTIRGRGKKRGTTIKFTPDQLAAVEHALANGYLRTLERAAIDYHLFPGRRLVEAEDGVRECLVDRPPIGRRAVGAWWVEAETLAGIPHVKGRACYGVRRVAVDGLLKLKISPKALQNAGGWDNAQMPNEIYADEKLEFAREEAAEKRAQLRGETDGKA